MRYIPHNQQNKMIDDCLRYEYIHGAVLLSLAGWRQLWFSVNMMSKLRNNAKLIRRIATVCDIHVEAYLRIICNPGVVLLLSAQWYK